MSTSGVLPLITALLMLLARAAAHQQATPPPHHRAHHQHGIPAWSGAGKGGDAPPQPLTTSSSAQQQQQQQQDEWFPECWPAANARIAFGGDRTVYYTPYTSDRWGNALSSYWAARSLAVLAGYAFDAYGGFTGASWLARLPSKVPAPPNARGDRAAFDAACNACGPEGWEHPHRCARAWLHLRLTIQAETHAAVEAWARAEGRRLPKFREGDVVIQARCAGDTVLAHPEYGPAAFSFYTRRIDPSTARRVFVVSDAAAALDPVCGAIGAARAAALRAALPGVEVIASDEPPGSSSSGESGGGASSDNSGGSSSGNDAATTAHLDFASLLRAPQLFRDSQSSFGLWAGVASFGRVYSVPLLAEFLSGGGSDEGGSHKQNATTAAATMPDMGPDWVWVEDAKVLYPKVAKEELGIGGDARAAVGEIVKWLRDN